MPLRLGIRRSADLLPISLEFVTSEPGKIWELGCAEGMFTEMLAAR